MSATHLQPRNNMPLIAQRQEQAERMNRVSRNACLVMLVLAIIWELGNTVTDFGQNCRDWDGEIKDLNSELKSAEKTARIAADSYRERVELNCRWDFDQSVPGMERDDEILNFCSRWILKGGTKYPKNSIPSIWQEKTLDCPSIDDLQFRLTKIPGMKLSCYAKAARKTEAAFQKAKERLAHKMAQKPMYCWRRGN